MTDKTLYIFDLREPVWKSVARDVVSFGGLVATAVALNTIMQPSAWLNAALAISWLLWLAGKPAMRKLRVSPDEARAWIDGEYPAQSDTRPQGGDAQQAPFTSGGVGDSRCAQTTPQSLKENSRG